MLPVGEEDAMILVNVSLSILAVLNIEEVK